MEQASNYFNNKNINEDERRNTAFQVLVAGRDLLQLANKKTQPPTYENSVGLINEIAPELYKDFITLLNRKNESELVQYFKGLAENESEKVKKTVDPISLIDVEIEKLRKLISETPKQVFKKKLLEHLVAREKMEPVRLTENKILMRDYGRIDRSSYANPHFNHDNYTDFILKNKNILRIKFLHPDSDEQISGADLIYEQYDLKTSKVRFIFLQYKVWENNVIYPSQAHNLETQLSKMEKILCNNNLCHSLEGTKHSQTYRLPFCAGFLRPTDRIQVNDSKMMSTGYHLPVCNALSLLSTDGKIEKKNIGDQSFKSHIFEELFNSNMIGSRWVDVDELGKIYTENKMFSSSDRIKLYALELLNEESVMISD